MIDFAEIIGFCAGACTTVSFLPQIKKLWITRSVDDISMHMYMLYTIGLVLWTVYSLLIVSWPLILANFITLIFVFSILCMKIFWSSPKDVD